MTAPAAEKILARALADLASLPPPAPTPPAPEPAPDPPLLLTVEEAATVLRLGRTEVFALIKTGELKSKKIGTRRRIPYTALVEYVTALPDDEPAPQ